MTLPKKLGAVLASSMLVLLVGCEEPPPFVCDSLGPGCTLRTAAEEAGVYMGTTSEGAGWADSVIGELVEEHFSSVTSQNELKWGELSSAPEVYDFTQADETIAFAQRAGLRVRGHALFWHRLNGPPAWLVDELDNAADPETRLRELMRQHVQTVMGRYVGRVQTWDVVNEPLDLFGAALATDSLFFDAFGSDEEFIDLAFQLAREADPEAKLFINEIYPSTDEDKFEGLLALVTGMVGRGVPIDGVGFQGHFFMSLPAEEVLRQRLQAFADLGLLVELTELDVSVSLLSDYSDPLAAQAGIYAGVVAACLSVPSCSGMTTWNVHDGLTWLDHDGITSAFAPHEPTLFDAQLRPKQAYHAVLDELVEYNTRQD